VNRRVVTTGAAIAGAVAFVLALVPGVAALVPTAAAVDAVGNDYFLLSAFGAVSLAVFGWMALRRAAGQVAQADPPDPETVPDAPRPGSRFDERLGQRPWGLDDADRRALAEDVRARTKPIILVANKADVAAEDTLDRLSEAADIVIPATADGELALRRASEAGVVDYDPGDPDFEITGDLSDAQRAGLERVREVMAAHGGTGVQRALDAAVYDLLDHRTAFPVENETKWTDAQGTVLPDAFLLPAGSTPPDLAAAVHTDIAEGYLHAVNGKTKRRIGEDYELQEGDVIKIVSTAS